MVIKDLVVQRQGRRKRQEDSYATNIVEHDGKRGLVTVVCDGCGAPPGGDVAASLVARIVSVGLLFALLRGEVSDKPGFEAALNSALDAAVARLAETEAADPALKGMATTLSVALCVDGRLYVANLGDSPVYLYRPVQDALVQLSVEHSRAVELLAEGTLTPQEFESSPFRSQLTSYVSADRRTCDHPSVQCLQQPRYGRLMLCSDGVREVLGREGVRAMLSNDSVDKTIEELGTALDQHADDNATAVIVEMSSTSPNAATRFPTSPDAPADAYCSACGLAAAPGAGFCDRCGHDLEPVDDRCLQVGRRVIPLDQDVTLGRELFCSPSVAREHLRFARQPDGQVWMEVLSTAAPVWKRVDAKADVLCIGDAVRIGDNPPIVVL